MNNLEILVERFAPRETYTIGHISIDGHYVSDCIEDRDRGLTSAMPVETIKKLKVYGETAIPKGRYRVLLTKSEKFSGREWAKRHGGLIPILEGVKGFAGVRIHPANTAEELLGCIAPGENTAIGRVNNSVAAYGRIMAQLLPAWNSNTPIYITII